MKRTAPGPIFHLQERASRNFELTPLADHEKIAHWNQAHRDDNYLFVFQEGGLSKLMLDFKEITIEGAAIFCILPGQVHQGLFARNSSAWALAVESACLKEAIRTVLTEFSLRNVPIAIKSPHRELLRESLLLLCLKKRGKNGRKTSSKKQDD